MPISDIFDIVKEWHKTKTADVPTGVKRSTVINMSWGYFSRYQVLLVVTIEEHLGQEIPRVTAYGMTGRFDGAGYRHPESCTQMLM